MAISKELVELGSHCLAYWRCDDNAANTTVLDSIGTYNMVLSGGANTSDISIAGKVGNAFRFDENFMSRPSIADQTGLRKDEFSVACWVYRRMTNPSTYTIGAEDYTAGGVGVTTSYVGNTCAYASAATGAGYCSIYTFATTDYGGISIYPNAAISTKGTNTLLFRTELYQNATVLLTSNCYSNGFLSSGVFYQGYQITGSSIGDYWFPESEATQFTYKIYSYGNQDFYIDRFQFDCYHNAPVGKADDWAFWSNGAQWRCECNSTDILCATSASNIPKDTWVFLTGTYSRSSQRTRIYVNGVLRNTTAIGGDYPKTWTTARIAIGGKTQDLTDKNSLFYGDVDNVMYFDKELTQAEIDLLYNSGSGIGLSDYNYRVVNATFKP